MTAVTSTSSTSSPATWARLYWPWALFLCVCGLTFIPRHYTGWVLSGGTGVLGVPELVTLLRRRYVDTLSDWFWRVLCVTQHNRMPDWSAVHFLAFGAYLTVAADSLAYMWHLGILPTGAAATLAVWLTRHLFFRWWR